VCRVDVEVSRDGTGTSLVRNGRRESGQVFAGPRVAGQHGRQSV
jgi:hypothetical protein